LLPTAEAFANLGNAYYSLRCPSLRRRISPCVKLKPQSGRISLGVIA
jgi:hypothetical protein